MAKFTTTRETIRDAAMELRGARFAHQGRNASTGVDCVGLLAVVGAKIGYPRIFDLTDYRRVPSASVIREMLRKNCREIPVDQVGVGDIYLMRMFGVKPRHTAIMVEGGDAPKIIHAGTSGVAVARVSDYPAAWYVAGFRVRGLKN